MNSKTVLIVDDEKAIVDILYFNLQKEGYTTLKAYDGKEGLRLAREAKPDLILLDVMLPYMDGFALCREIPIISTLSITITAVCIWATAPGCRT